MEIHVQSFGARLRMRGGLFVINVPDRSGGGQDQEQEFAPHQAENILLYSNGGSLSTSAIELALKNEVDILICDSLGNVIGSFHPSQPAAPVIIQTAQFRLIGTARSMQFVKEWMGIMFRRKMHLLKRLERRRAPDKQLLLKTARQKLASYAVQLNSILPYPVAEAANAIRLIEAHASKLYFNTLSSLLPPEYQFESRSRRPAKDWFNAFLNYGYGVLYRIVERLIVKSGLHPYAGFLHSIERNQKAFLFDIMELYRTWVDHIVCSFFSAKEVSQKHVQEHDGGYWLSQPGKALLLKIMLGQYDEPQQLEEEDQSRLKNFMKIEIQSIAQSIRREGKLLLQPALSVQPE